MSEDTKFPESWDLSNIDSDMLKKEEWYVHDSDIVCEWFKRCMDDFPTWIEYQRYHEWFDKWFSQFRKRL